MISVYIPDETDWKIIKLLNKDGRMPSTEIAEKLGNITARTVNNRIKALTKDGIITVRAVIDPDKVGYGVLADAYIEVEPGLVSEVANLVANLPEISYVACAIGDVDVSVSIRAQTIRELFDFVESKLGKIPGVRRTQTHILPVRIKDLDTWFPPKAMETIDNSNQSIKNGTA